MRELTHDLAEIVRRASKYYRVFFWAPRLDRHFRRTTQEALCERPLRSLCDLARHAATNVPFYRELYSRQGIDANNITDWNAFRRLPVVTKEDLRRNYPDRIVVDSRHAHPSEFGRSSGSTGEAVQFLHQHGWKKTVYYMLLWQRKGIMSPRTAMLLTPQCSNTSCSITDRRTTLEDRIRNLLVRTRLNAYFQLPSSTDIFREPDSYFEELLRQIRGNRVEVLCGTPNYLGQLARHMLAKGETFPARAVVCYTELLLASVKAELSEAFQCPVYNHYGAGEVPGVADECREGRWHVRVDINHVEIVDDDDEPVEPGTVGRLLITPLDNYRMPLIRYDVGDLAVSSAPGSCPCGRNNPTLVHVAGRYRDAWRGARGQLVSPADVADRAHRAGLRGRYRVVQQSASDVDVEWVREDCPGDVSGVGDKLARELSTLLGTPQRVDILPIKYIPTEKSNKYRLIFSRYKPPMAGRRAATAQTELTSAG